MDRCDNNSDFRKGFLLGDPRIPVSVIKTETGCGHALSRHYKDVTGSIRCIDCDCLMLLTQSAIREGHVDVTLRRKDKRWQTLTAKSE
jgi:hypothetical protein